MPRRELRSTKESSEGNLIKKYGFNLYKLVYQYIVFILLVHIAPTSFKNYYNLFRLCDYFRVFATELIYPLINTKLKLVLLLLAIEMMKLCFLNRAPTP